MAIRNILKGINLSETIPISFTNTATQFNIVFSRNGDTATIMIPATSFNVSIETILKSTTQIPDKYLPLYPSMNWIVINGQGGYVASSVLIDNTGITISFGGQGTYFEPASNYITTNSQPLSYLI